MSLTLGHHGMLAEINKLVGALYEYVNGRNPDFYVTWNQDNCAYVNKNQSVAPSINIFNIYFKQPLLNKSSPGRRIGMGEYRQLMTSYEKRNELSLVINKYIKPIDSIQKQINDFLFANNSDVKIGCHIRGRRFSEFDFSDEERYGSCKNEFDYFKSFMEQYVTQIKSVVKVLDSNKTYKIFIFTDNKPALEYLRNIFGDKLEFYEDIIRSDRFFKAEIHTARGTDKYKCGTDIVKEVFTMLKMNYFISAKYGNIPLFVVNGNDKLIHVSVK